MNQGKKALNVLGIIVSLLLSIVLVLYLAVTPLTMSTLSLLHPETLTDAITKVDFENTIGEIVEESGEALEDQQVKQLGAVLSTNAAKELMKTYTQSVLDTLGGKTDTQGITEEMLQQIVSENKAELAQALKESGGEYATMSDDELMNEIQTVVDENTQEILEMLPDPQELKQELMADNPQMELALVLVTAVNTVKLILIGAAVVLCLIIFFCRFVNLRGVKWLGIDLLIAGILSAVISGSFSLINSVLSGLAEGSALASSLIDALVGSINSGLKLRTTILLVVAVVLLALYIGLCVYKKKKAQATPAADAQPAVPELAEPNE